MTELAQRLKRVDDGSVYLPQRTLLVLCGIPGSGKSTFAREFIVRQGLQPTTIVSSDYCRALICDDETNQQVSRDAFDLFHYIIYKRMQQRRFIIADSTALLANARHRLFEQAVNYQYATCLLVFTVDPTICIQRDRTRQRIVGEAIIRNLQQLLEQALRDIPNEQWQQVYRVEDRVPPSTLFIRH
ncbi:MAG TPA: hypothetical protein DHW02_00515 [Ktedonobacter sp.]|nr:hypothetical protein [Ktedonobacter sp.]